jgi:hypothetical protein
MGTGPMGPAVGARSRSGDVRTMTTRVSIGTTRLTSRLASVTLMRNAGRCCSTRGHHGHHLGHWGQKSSLTSSKGQVALLESSIGSVCWRDSSRWRIVMGRDSFKETLGNKISHFSNSVSLMEGLLMKDITSSREVAEVTLGIAKMLKHVGPSTFNDWAAIPEAEILFKNWLASKNDIGKIYHLLRGYLERGHALQD